MKSLLISAVIVAISAMIAAKAFLGNEAPTPTKTEAPTKFLSRCREVSSGKQKVEAYCACLWSNGLSNMTQIMTKPERAKVIVAKCSPPPPRK